MWTLTGCCTPLRSTPPRCDATQCLLWGTAKQGVHARFVSRQAAPGLLAEVDLMAQDGPVFALSLRFM